MSAQAGPQTTRTPASYASYDEERGQGWVMFAGVLLLILGTLNVIEGSRRSARRTSMSPTRTTCSQISRPGDGSC